MDRCGLHRGVDEVRIIIGPKFDMLVKLDNDHEDLILRNLLRTKSRDPSRSPRT